MSGSAPTTGLEADNLYRFFHAGGEETLALRGVSLAVRPGDMVAVVGPSGSGKSTLLACLAGLDEPDGGTVRVDDTVLSRRPEWERAQLRAKHIGVLFQSANLIEHLTVVQNVGLAQRLAGRRDGAEARALLDRLGLGSRLQSSPSHLSGGESARAGLAVALANRPAVLLADEPTGEVDGETEHEVLVLLREQAINGTSVVVVTHSDAVAQAADRTIRMADGRVIR